MERVDLTADRAMRILLAEQPLTDAKVRFAWTIVAGPAVARAATVTFADGTLFVRTKSESWFHAVRRAQFVMVQRLGRLLGPDVVRTIVVTHDDATRHTLHHRPGSV